MRKNGEGLFAAPPEPVFTTVPSAKATSSDKTASAAVPWMLEPKKILFCDSAPPTVAYMPEKGPK